MPTFPLSSISGLTIRPRLRLAFSLRLLCCTLLLFAALPLSPPSRAQDPFIPRKQTRPPGPPLSPEEALKKMTVPEGFHVELVAAEPQIQNPVAMAFDDSGRIYVTESFEYPRREPGPGRDTIKILEDTDGDGRVDNVKVFAEGLNIPSGIAVGHGGVWVANAPDLLFLEDTDGDDRADKQTVIATGFGRDDTHELPNALTWGPDGFLYGLNGVFNRSKVRQGDNEWEFTCAMFRIDPVTRKFELFCEGTSNPWGIAFNQNGDAFISACVIDHLWHLTETGYYHRQAGAYPPNTWKIESIVDYKHQMAAYCGIEFFDSPAYPEAYRNKLYMGNIHGGCINVDGLAPNGSTYRGVSHPDFLTANDVWFMPVAQKVGPDGCLYILDWYDRYHCYQDANADPSGVDRGHGRLYRVVYDQRPSRPHADLDQLKDEALVELLTDANIFNRQRAAVILSHRIHWASHDDARLGKLRNALITQMAQTQQHSPDALPVHDFPVYDFPVYLAGTLLRLPGLGDDVLSTLLRSGHPQWTVWTLRALGSRLQTIPASEIPWEELTTHPSPAVRLQTAICLSKLDTDQTTDYLLKVLDSSSDDPLIPRIVWKNLSPRLTRDWELVLGRITACENPESSLIRDIAPRAAAQLLARCRPDLAGDDDRRIVSQVLKTAVHVGSYSDSALRDMLNPFVARLHSGELRIDPLRDMLGEFIPKLGTQTLDGLQLLAFTGNTDAANALVAKITKTNLDVAARTSALTTLALANPDALVPIVRDFFAEDESTITGDAKWQTSLLGTVARSGSQASIELLTSNLARLQPGIQAGIASTLAQSPKSAPALLRAITQGKLRKEVVGLNDLRTLADSPSDEIQSLVKQIWGTLRLDASPDRQKVVSEMTTYLSREARGNPTKGWLVYDRTCGQCHTMHGRGNAVGPDLTRNGRGNFEQLIISVFDPSLVIGDAYQSVSVLTVDGRLLTGVVTEESPQRLVLRVQGGKDEVIPRDDIEQVRKNPVSLMPEGLEQQISREELADLFALLAIEEGPDAPSQTLIPGTPEKLHQPSGK